MRGGWKEGWEEEAGNLGEEVTHQKLQPPHLQTPTGLD